MGQPRDESLADEGHGDGGQDEIEYLGDLPGTAISEDTPDQRCPAQHDPDDRRFRANAITVAT
jgi:hypothetical protein